ncbi:MAG: hypothetical protein H0T71_09320, partial [Acidobacteria bacterium]|nr:hypothetical protein [Acidobacteriota bacterium]
MMSLPAFAQQRPLVTEDPETVGGGRLLIEAGVEWKRDLLYPVSGLRGNHLAVPTFGLSIGLSSIAELQIDGGFYQRLDITERRAAPLANLLAIDGDRTTDVEDFVVATKVRLLTETGGRPAVGLRLATKLPNASNESGLGTDMTDFFATLLLAKTIESVRVVGNTGVAILGDSTSGEPEQNDLLTFGLSVARAMTTAAELVGEINGRLNLDGGTADPGAENRAVLRLGGRYTRGPVRVDVAVLLGMTSLDPQIGLTTGFTWVLN